MITDRISKLEKYEGLRPYAEKIREFIAYAAKEALPDGRYELLGEEMFALVQTYETRKLEDCRIEGHRKYSDLQYIAEGNEYIYWNPAEELETEEDRTPDEDILFYAGRITKGCTRLTKGMFGFYLPSDGHMPCAAVEECSPVKKIVFKIQYHEELRQ